MSGRCQEVWSGWIGVGGWQVDRTLPTLTRRREHINRKEHGTSNRKHGHLGMTNNGSWQGNLEGGSVISGGEPKKKLRKKHPRPGGSTKTWFFVNFWKHKRMISHESIVRGKKILLTFTVNHSFVFPLNPITGGKKSFLRLQPIEENVSSSEFTFTIILTIKILWPSCYKNWKTGFVPTRDR